MGGMKALTVDIGRVTKSPRVGSSDRAWGTKCGDPGMAKWNPALLTRCHDLSLEGFGEDER